MNPRATIIEQFTTFIRWRHNQFGSWSQDQPLRRHIERHSHPDQEYSSQSWANYWHQLRQQQSPPPTEQKQTYYTHHLYAYLQEPCYRIANKLYTTYQDRTNQTRADLFSLGILSFPRILNTYNPTLNPNLAAHAHTWINWRILDELRRLDRSSGQTLWGQLQRTSEYRRRQALLRLGLRDDALDCHLQAWECYTNYAPSLTPGQDGRIQPPDPLQWQEITALYPAHMPPIPEPSQLQAWIETCGQALHHYLSLPTQSLNQPLNQDSTQEHLDMIPTSTLTPLDQAIYQDLQTQIKDWVQTEWDTLDLKAHRLNPHTRTIFQRYYGDEQEQTQIATALNLNQATISRTINKVKTLLTQNFMVWAPQTMHITLDLNDIETINAAMAHWLLHLFHSQKAEQDE